MNKINTLLKKSPHLREFALVSIFCFLTTFTAYAQLQNIPVTGFNNDIVANGTGATNTVSTGSLAGMVTQPAIGVDGVGYTFIDATFKWYSGSTAPTCYLPTGGSIPSAITSGLSYQLQDYSSSNALTVVSNTYSGSVWPTTGSVSLVTPGSYSNIYVLYESVMNTAGPTITATVNFSDATTQVFSGNSLSNWFTATGVAYTPFISRVQNVAPGTLGACNTGPYLFQLSLPLSVGNYSKTVQSISFNWSSAVGTTANTIDYFHVMAVGGNTPCTGTPSPGNTVASANPVCSGVSFTLSLQNPSASGTTFQWQSSPDGSTWTNIAAATSSTLSTTQTVATYYQCLVTCTAGPSTGTSNPVNVTMSAPNTCYCTPTTTGGTTYFISNMLTTGGITNLNNTSGGSSGYQNFFATASMSAMQGSSVNFTMTIAGGSTYGKAIWVDWNQDGTFAAGEQVASSSAYASSPISGSFVVPLTATTGITRMRVVATFTPNNPSNPCSNSGSGEFEDYAFNVILLPPCTTPSAQPALVSLAAASTSQINGSFNAATGSPSGYLVVRYPSPSTEVLPVDGTTYVAGNSLGLGTVVQSSNALSFVNTGLNGGTTYDYYVYSYNTLCAGAPFYLTTGGFFGTQSTNSCSSMSGVIPVGPTAPAAPAGFPTLSGAGGALAYIVANGLGGATILELQTDYSTASETLPFTFSSNACINSSKPLTIRPASGVSSPFVFSTSNTSAVFIFDGGSYITIDGRNGGTGSNKYISIINTSSTAASAGNAILMRNEASNNTLTYLDLKASNLNPAGNTGTVTVGAVPGVVAILSTTGANGNDNNTISNCDIHSATSSGNILNVGIYAYNATTVGNASNNDNNTITNNNIFDWFNAATATAGIDILVGNNNYTISNNSFYKSAAIAYTYTAAAITHRAMWITPNASAVASSGFTIAGNYIGGTGPLCAGSPYTTTGATTYLFNGMDISVGTASFTSIQNNTITNFNFTTANTGSTAFVGINIANGNINCGTVTGNLIGSTTTNGAITFTATANTGGLIGIRTGAGTTINISNNIISGIDLIANPLTVTPVFNGINAGGGTTVNIANNTIGSTTLANSINAVSASTSASAQTIRGIIVNGGTTSTVTGNTIANMNSNILATSGSHTVVGVAVTIGSSTVSGNTIRNLTSSSQSTAGGATPSAIGISYTSTTAPAIISGNTIHTIKNTNTTTTSGPVVAGIYYGGASGTTNVIEKNNIHSLVLSSNTVSASAAITGMDIASGQVTIRNNMIRLGYDENGNSIIVPTLVRGISKNTNIASIYFNSIYIGGTGVLSTVAANTFAFTRTAAASSDDIRNNIFVNNRSNATTGGKHYQISLSSIATLTLNFNDYYGNGTGSVFASNVGVDVASYSPGWVTGDLSSQTGDPKFINPTGGAALGDLHIHPTNQTIIEQNGVNLASVTDDYDGQLRASFTPEDIGADAGNFVGFFCAGPPASATAALTVPGQVCGNVSKTLILSGFTALPGYTYQWQESSTGLPGSFVNVSGGTGATTSSYTTALINSPTYYQCEIGCSFGGSPITSTVAFADILPAPVMAVTPSSGTNVCSGANVDLAASGANSYVWTVNPGLTGYPIVALLTTRNNLATVTSRPTSTLATSTTTPPATSSTPTWIYTVTGTALNGCTSASSVTLNVITTPVVPNVLTYSYSPSTNCAPGTPITFTLNNNGSIGAGQWVYNWYDQTGATLLQSTTNSLNSDDYTPVTPATNGNYIYTAKVSNTLCPSSYAIASPTYFVGFTSLKVSTDANCGDNGTLKVYPEGQNNFSTWYFNNFSVGAQGPAFDAVYGNTVITAGQCRITPQAGSQTGAFLVRNPGAINTNNLQVDFKLSTAPRGFAFNILGADGLCWSYGGDVTQGTVTTGGLGEGGSGTGLKLAFDATANTGSNTPGIYLMYNSLVAAQGPTDAGVLAFKYGSSWQGLIDAPVSITITQSGLVTVSVNNEVIFDHVQLPAAYLTANKSNWIHSFTSRTGGSNQLHAIDDLNIRYNQSYEYSINSTNGTDGTWSTNNSYTGLASGTYPVWVRNTANPTCVANTGNASIGTSPSPSSSNTIAAPGFNTTICAGSSTDLTTSVSVPGAVFLWEEATSLGGPYTAAAGTNTTEVYSTGALTSSKYYRCTFTCPSASAVTSTPVLVTVNIGSISSTNSPQQINCIGNSVTLTATPGANTTAVWYDVPTGGSPLFTGNSYNVTPTSLPKTYYVEPVTTLYTNHFDNAGETAFGNILGTVAAGTGISSRFTTSASIRIDSIKVYATASGSLTVSLQNALSTTNIQTYSTTISAAQVGNFINLPVNLIVPGSGNYQLTTGGVATCNYYSSYTGSYASSYMSLGGVFSIVGGSTSATGATSTFVYGSALNWSITTSCPAGFGNRTAVVVNSNPGFLVSVTPSTLNNFCPTVIQPITASSPNSYSSYTWSPVTNLYSDAAATVPLTLADNQATVYFKASGAGSNTYTVSTAASGCTNTATASISVVSALPITTSATPAAICSGEDVQLSASVPSSNYSITSIPFAPQAVPATASTVSGDEATQTVNLGFSFAYFGTVYTNAIIHTNGYIQIGGSTTVCTSCYTPPTAPSTATPNNWAGIWSDMSVTAGQVTYGTTGVAPNRKFIVNYDNVNFFSATPASTHQIILNESDNSIEIHLTSNTTTSTNARAMGIENLGGTAAYVPAGRNSGTWTATSESWKFAPINAVFTYDWSANSTFLSATNISNPVAQAMTSSQLYSVQVLDPSTGCVNTANVNVTVNDLPSATAGSNTPICEGQTLSLFGDNTDPLQTSGNSYEWSGPNGFNDVVQNPTISGTTPSAAGTYTVTVTNSNGCEAEATTTVGVNPLPALNVLSQVNVGCTGGSDGSFTIEVTNAVPFGNYLYDENGNTNFDGIFTNYSAGSYTVQVTDDNSCQSSIGVTIGTISTAPPAGSCTIATIPVSGCVGTNVTVSTTVSPGATGYNWSVPAGTLINGLPGPLTTVSNTVTLTLGAVPANASGWEICAFASNGCGQTNTNCKYIRGVLSLPPAITGSTVACPSTTGIYSTLPVSGANGYSWTGTNGITFTGSGTSVTANFPSGFTSGTICVGATLPCGYTGPTRCINVSNGTPLLGAMSGTFTVCPGTNNVAYSVPPSPGANTYNWTLPAFATIATGAGTNSITVNFGASYAGGNICVTAQSVCGINSLPRCKTIGSNKPGTPGNIVGAATGICGQNVTYSVGVVTGATSYTWTAPGGASLNSPNGTNAIDVLYPSNYTNGNLCVTANNGCGSSTPRCIPVKGSPANPGTISGPAVICAFESGDVYSVAPIFGASAYVWVVPSGAVIQSGQGTSSILVDWGASGGLITVTATGTCGNSGTKTLNVVMNCKVSGAAMPGTEITAYPNPVSTELTLELNAITSGSYHVEMIDLSGRIVYSQEISASTGMNNSIIDVSNFSKGVYTLSVKNNDGFAKQIRVAVQ